MVENGDGNYRGRRLVSHRPLIADWVNTQLFSKTRKQLLARFMRMLVTCFTCPDSRTVFIFETFYSEGFFVILLFLSSTLLENHSKSLMDDKVHLLEYFNLNIYLLCLLILPEKNSSERKAVFLTSDATVRNV